MKKKLKTFREHFEKYPEPYRSQAIKNTGNYADVKNYIFTYDPLAGAFVWEDSPEGHEYWEEFNNNYNGKSNS